jgi:hypothetical protein
MRNSNCGDRSAESVLKPHYKYNHKLKEWQLYYDPYLAEQRYRRAANALGNTPMPHVEQATSSLPSYGEFLPINYWMYI